jgi:hypothetical protein
MAHDSQYRGGPRSAAGKRVSSANAMKHGMTARRPLPCALQPGCVESYRSQLRDKYAPSTPVEDLLVNEPAPHAAMLEFGEQAEGAVLRYSALDVCSFISQDGPSPTRPAGGSRYVQELAVFCRGQLALEALESLGRSTSAMQGDPE